MIIRALPLGCFWALTILALTATAQEGDTTPDQKLPTGSDLPAANVSFDRAERLSREGDSQASQEAYQKAEGAAHFTLGKIALRRGDLQTAQYHFDIAESAGADGAELHYWLGVYELNHAQFLAEQGVTGGLVVGSFTDAFDEFARAIELGSQRPEAWIGRGQAQFNMYRFEEALASFEKGLGRFPRNEALLAAKADLHLSLYTNLREQDEDAASSHWDEAVAGYRSIAESAGGDTLSRYQAYSYQKIAEAHRWREDLEAARSALTEGIERDASASGLYGPLYSAMSSEDRLDELAGFLRQVAERQAGREATPMWYLGYTELQRENWDAAIEAYRRSAQANPEFTAGARSQIAECFVSQGARAQADGDTEMALSYYLRALDADPGHDSAVQGVGSLGASQVSESNEAGRRFFAKVTSMYEDRADWWNNYAFFCRETGKYEESYQAYERALELAPNDARIINDLALILLYHLDRDLDRAEDMFYRSWRLGRDVYEDSTQDPAVRDEAFITFGDAMENLVLLYVQQERWEEAKPICDELLEIQPQRPAAVQYRRRIEQALGEDKSSGDGDDGR